MIVLCVVYFSCLLHLSLPSCILDKQKVEARNVKFMSATWNPNNDPTAPSALQSQSKLEVVCSQEAYTFSNQIRRTDGVNITWLDTWGTITATCDSGTIYPNIFYEGTDTPDYYPFYCRPGCTRLLETERKATYPPLTSTEELYSAPVRHSSIAVSVACNDGYAQLVGDTGKATISCNHLVGWDSSPDQLIKCKAGCPDIRYKVKKARTQTAKTGNDGEPAFSAGDIVKFECENGYEIQGYTTVTCSGVNVWSYSMPTCKYNTALCCQLTLGVIVLFVVRLLFCSNY